jgi:hypothetical protein
MNKKPIIYIESSNDAGVPFNDSEHEKYCEQVINTVLSFYPYYKVICEPADVNRTKVKVTNTVIRRCDETLLESEVENICQEVWEQGDFWD